jgi:hypothetical protein
MYLEQGLELALQHLRLRLRGGLLLGSAMVRLGLCAAVPHGALVRPPQARLLLRLLAKLLLQLHHHHLEGVDLPEKVVELGLHNL